MSPSCCSFGPRWFFCSFDAAAQISKRARLWHRADCPLDQKGIGKYKPHKGVEKVAFDLITLIMLIVPGFWSMWIY
jgi:hypothetical protein